MKKFILSLFSVLLAVTFVISPILPAHEVEAAPTDIFRIASSGSTNWGDTTKWSLSSGGAAAGIAPNVSSTVILDDNSGFNSATVISLTANIEVASFTATHSPERILIQSNTLGTARTFTSGVVTIVNIDFMDITGAGAAAWDFLAQNDIGDCGGNTGITFPAAVTHTSIAASTWSNPAMWDTGTIPLPQDDVSCSHSVTVDMPRAGKSVTFTGTPTVTLGNDIANYGSFILPTGSTYTHNNKTNSFRGRGSYNISTNSIELKAFNILAPSGIYTFQSNWVSKANADALNICYITNGNLITNGYTVTAYLIYSRYTTTRGLSLGNSIIYLTASGVVTKWDFNTTAGLTFDAGTSTIILTNSGINTQTFAGGGLTYNNVIVQGAGAYALTVTGSNVFNTFTANATQAAKTIIATGTTQTVDDFTRDSGTNIITLTNGTWDCDGTAPMSLDYMSVTGSTATPANTWYAGTHSTDGGGNTGWIFDYPMWLAIYLDGVLEGQTLVPEGASVPDNANDITVMENNSVVYADNMTLDINGIQQIYYNPNDILVSTGATGTLPDRSAGTANDCTLTWGSNPAGIAITLGSMSASTQPTISDFEEETPRDVLPIAPVSDWYGDGTISKASTLASPFRTAVTVVSDNTTLSEIQVWRFYGLVIWLFVTVAAGFSLRGHLGITMMVSGATLGGLVAFDYNIFPLWLLIITIGCFIGGFIAERSPSL